MKDSHKKESPLLTLSTLGGGSNSFLYSGGGDTLSDKYWFNYLRPNFSTNVAKVRVAVDKSGNVFTSGAEKPNSSAGTNVEGTTIAKYDASGVFQWDRHIWYQNNNYNEHVYFENLATDNDGNVYAAGWGTYGNTGTSDDIPIVKYDTNGNLQWQITFYTSSLERCYGMDVDGAGNIYLAIYTFHTASGAGYEDPCVVAKINSSGVLQWQKGIGGDSGTQDFNAEGIKVDSSGNVYVTGSIYDAGFGKQTGFIIKLDSSGNRLWQRNLIPSSSGALINHVRLYDVAVDSNDNPYVVGYTSIGVNNTHGIIASWDASGTGMLYYKKFGTHGLANNFDTYLFSIAIDKYDNIYTTGYISGISYYEANYTTTDAIIAKWDTSLNLQWQRTFGRPTYVGNNSVESTDIDVDKSGNVYVAAQVGVIERDTYFYGVASTSATVVKLPSDGSLIGMYESQWYRAPNFCAASSVLVTSSSTASTYSIQNSGFTVNSTQNTSTVNRGNTSVTVTMSDINETTEIVTSGLDFHIDAGNPSSYSGSGTTVNSLVGNITSSSFNSNIYYNSENGGYWSFRKDNSGISQTDPGMSFDGSFADITGSVSHSFDFWMRYRWYSYHNFVAISFHHSVYPAGQTNSNTEILEYWGGYGTQSGQDAQMFLWAFHPSYGQVGTASDFDPITDSNSSISSNGNGQSWSGNNDWWHIAVTVDATAGEKKVYANGTLILTDTSTYYTTIRSISGGTPRLYVGDDPYENGLNGDLAIARVYKNKILTASEILQNFNAEKTRFGLTYS